MFIDLETNRLHLKNICANDRTFIYNQFSNDFINKYLFDAEPVTSLTEADEIISFYCIPEPRNQHRWIIAKKDTEENIGTCGFHCWNKETNTCEMGYDLLEIYNNKGFMNESIEKIIEFAHKTMKIETIHANIYFENQKSINLVKKNGFVKTGEKIEIFRNREYLHYIYTLGKKD